jgi:hypothetical protein|tara:strand:+ start:130 stop:519 length:390 start_codon:yes stop_codon:yes gene_type:complete
MGIGRYAVTNRHLTVVDVGLDAEVLDVRAVGGAGGASPSISVRHAKVAAGTADLCAGAAMSEHQLARALEVGRTPYVLLPTNNLRLLPLLLPTYYYHYYHYAVPYYVTCSVTYYAAYYATMRHTTRHTM